MPFSMILRKGTKNGSRPRLTCQQARSAIGGAQWGMQFLSRGMAPKLAGELKSMGGDRLRSGDHRKETSAATVNLAGQTKCAAR